MYKVLIDTLNHDGRLRVPGELIEMGESDAMALIKIGAIEAVATVVDNPLSGSDDQGNQAPETGNKASKSKAK